MPRVADSLASRGLRRLGESLGERYRIDRLVGIGGMGAVYAGRDLGRATVAIKILHEGLAWDPEIERRFRREAQLANEIGHPRVVPVIDDGVTDDGCVFLVMPLLEGETLGARAKRHEGARLPLTDVVVVAHAVLGALEAAHAKRIVHRDVKPENIFLTSGGEIRVLDFGIGRFFETTDPALATQTGRAVGTPAFMSPEQALGRTREVDGRTDLWALGATMFSLLSGKFVHEGETGSEICALAATRAARLLGEVAPEVPEGVRGVVDRALRFAREERWESAEAMREALREVGERELGQRLAEAPCVRGITAEASDGTQGAEATQALRVSTISAASHKSLDDLLTLTKERRGPQGGQLEGPDCGTGADQGGGILLASSAAKLYLFTWNDVLVLVDYGKARPADYEVVGKLIIAEAAKHPAGIGGLTIVPRRATPPPEDARLAINTLMRRLYPLHDPRFRGADREAHCPAHDGEGDCSGVGGARPRVA